MESKPPNPDDVYEFKSAVDSELSTEKSIEQTDGEKETMQPQKNQPNPQLEETGKRHFVEVIDCLDEANEDDSRRKKRKDDAAKDTKTTVTRHSGQIKGQNTKQTGVNQNKTNTTKTGSIDKKSPCASPKATTSSDIELDDGRTDLKVPPLKIVIPQGANNDQETISNRNGKNNSQRAHPALPYVVASSNSNDSIDKEVMMATSGPDLNKTDEKKNDSNGGPSEEQRGVSNTQRVLRSSHRSGNNQYGTDRGSNNSSPQLQRSLSPSPSGSPAAVFNANCPSDQASSTSTSTSLTSKLTDTQIIHNADTETVTPSTASISSTTVATVELHPRKRKMKPSKDSTSMLLENSDTPAEAQVHPHEQPITNCYQLYLNIRNQISKRRRGLFPVQPKPPQGFKDYLMNRCTYVLSGTASINPNVSYPPSLPIPMRDLFAEQEKERYRLRMQHVIEKEKLVLSVEQEILRVHGRAARALANQSLPYSVCTILRDEEVYNLITPEQEEKDRNARSRSNGRLFISWLQDVDDKWEKIKESMLLRHHNEAESLHAVQKMNWEWKLKELSLCDRKITPSIDEHHVPMVHVSDDFDLLPT